MFAAKYRCGCFNTRLQRKNSGTNAPTFWESK